MYTIKINHSEDLENGLSEDQNRIVYNVLNLINDRISNKAERIPSEWNGIELARYIADIAKENAPDKFLTGKRKKDYKNEILVKNL